MRRSSITFQSVRERPVHKNVALVLRQEAIDKFERGGLTRAASPEKDKGFRCAALQGSGREEVSSRHPQAIPDAAKFNGRTMVGRVCHWLRDRPRGSWRGAGAI